MKNSRMIVLLSTLLTSLLLSACATVSGEGMGDITNIGNGQFEILAAGGLSGDRSVIQQKFERTATKACNGKTYKTIKRDWQGAAYPGLLGGIIECNK